ncbi:DUF6631 family protein [Ottowia testudinis]|uniref:Uncharacterized protein n=1 Tax=Ottowia testudinis TaxID=2816950 RepID=A0A975H2N8_9BURK|nr:DUF6631 family protein [Ottowia testudinis]QTD44974.1 hypothetical protein J1M35_18300 [Ottowia testudinis]
MTEADTDDLAVLIPQPVTLTLGGQTVALTPIRVSEIQPLTRCITPIAKVLMHTPPGQSPDWLTLVVEHTDAVIDTLVIAARCSKEWVQALTVGELVLLAAKVVEVNADFLLQTVWPQLQGTIAVLTQGMAKVTGVPAAPTNQPAGATSSSA